MSSPCTKRLAGIDVFEYLFMRILGVWQCWHMICIRMGITSITGVAWTSTERPPLAWRLIDIKRGISLPLWTRSVMLEADMHNVCVPKDAQDPICRFRKAACLCLASLHPQASPKRRTRRRRSHRKLHRSSQTLAVAEQWARCRIPQGSSCRLQLRLGHFCSAGRAWLCLQSGLWLLAIQANRLQSLQGRLQWKALETEQFCRESTESWKLAVQARHCPANVTLIQKSDKHTTFVCVFLCWQHIYWKCLKPYCEYCETTYRAIYLRWWF